MLHVCLMLVHLILCINIFFLPPNYAIFVIGANSFGLSARAGELPYIDSKHI